MLAMQYTLRRGSQFGLPAAADRMSRRDPLFHDLEGLVHKAYFYDEGEQLYAPFYVWRHHDAVQRFLVDGLFDGVANEFGRPRVRTWYVLHFSHGDRSLEPTHACCEIDQVGAEELLPDLAAREADAHSRLLDRPGLYAHAVALDPDRWEITRFSLWDDKASVTPCTADCVRTYRVLGVYESDKPED